MNWAIFAVFAYLHLMVESGLTPLWSGTAGYAPDLLLILLAFIAISASPWEAAVAGLILGCLTDLAAPYRLYTGGPMIIGPAALGYLAAAYTGSRLRTTAFRDSAATVAMITGLAGLAGAVTTVLVMVLRRYVPWLSGERLAEWSALTDLTHRVIQLIVTSSVALPLGWLLIKSDRLWDFGGGRRIAERPRRAVK